MQCPKCGGKGHIALYNYVANGVCFLCNGHGTVNSNGKRVEIKAKHIVKPLAGLNKTQTAILYDAAIVDAAYTCTEPQKDLEALLMAGFVTVMKTKRGYTYRFCANGLTGIIKSDLDWSLVSV